MRLRPTSKTNKDFPKAKGFYGGPRHHHKMPKSARLKQSKSSIQYQWKENDAETAENDDDAE